MLHPTWIRLALAALVVLVTLSAIPIATQAAFTDIGAGLMGVSEGSAAWGDYDNDGDLDILMTGNTGSGRISRVYENDAGTFTDIAAGLTGVYSGSVAWGDYDNDGDLDILMTGYTDSYEHISRVYENDAGTFTDIAAGLTGVRYGSVAWGDYDNDGDLDILMTGETGSFEHISRVYENAAGTFTDIAAGLTGVWYGSAAWGDYDNDGDLDILMTGNTGSGYISRVYENDGAPANTAPTPPTNLSCFVVGNLATLSWNAATDNETPSAGLTYNLRVGTTPGGDEICSSMADPASGYRRVVQLGNTNHNTTWAITLPDTLPPWAYWSVQALDGAFEGSAFAAEQSFAAIEFTDIAAGLTGVDYSSAAWGDCDNDGDLDILLTGYTGSGYISRVYENDAGTFTDIAAGLTGVWRSSVAWGDYDNDGDLDILMTGYTDSERISRVYENDAGTFTDIAAGLTGVAYSSVAWGDCDNDGDLDILLTGYTGSGYISRVYENDAGTFTDIAAGLTGVGYNSMAWGDYDNDGDLDILMTGYMGSYERISRVYESNGAEANTAPAPPTNLSCVVAGDRATLSWDAATDSETPSAGLTYNLRVGTTPGGDEICSSMADPASGYRRVVRLGNTNHNTTWAITLPDTLPPWAFWSVQAVDGAFEGSAFAAVDTILLGATGIDDPEDGAPVTALRLYPCAPNPFNPRTVIHYDLPTEAPVRVSIYDAAGRHVATLVDDPAHAPGRHEAIWDGRSANGRSVASGIYFCRMESGDFREVRKMALVR